ncbi:hypothetical protein CTN00_01560 [Fusobacterium pseudoperiodonticum]|uniref:Riboflavin synthase subunit alpha n=2 Tax=Fusobacterium TaxID=848 RepID=A0AAD0HTT4_9FUSO|nr:hypothetical protein CTM64_04625 [Fusobacterium pseudoperiodonticum]AVQ24780.1 hypothetical protein C4N17_03150 [Fusobacterium periodonticum]ATV61717.1 hypothetical protein CTM74_07730 [Fusobacterium pseudoperiodonticum]ATV63625.1 hypothetical protein CTM78_03975 [Fusobacterium pseudoperiodonticum]ATV67407.1 hypothetical protein CTM92_01460 [Fusobacterium pseudoperiodonticum]
MCLSEASLTNLQRILNFYSLRNLASNELFFIYLFICNNPFLLFFFYLLYVLTFRIASTC